MANASKAQRMGLGSGGCSGGGITLGGLGWPGVESIGEGRAFAQAPIVPVYTTLVLALTFGQSGFAQCPTEAGAGEKKVQSAETKTSQ